MAKTVKGITIEIEGKTSGLAKSLSDIDKQLKTTQDALKQVDSALKLDPKNVEVLASKQKLLTEAIESTKKKLELEEQAADKAREALKLGTITEADYATLISNVSKTSTELDKMQQEAKDTADAIKAVDSNKVKDVGDAAQKSKEKMLALKDATKLLKDGLVKVSKAAQSLISGSVSSAMDYESAFAGVMKTVDETATTTYDDISDAIKKMAEETGTSKEEIAGVAEAAGQLGVSADNIAEFTKTMVMLGDTTNLSAEEAASALAQFMNITGGSQSDVDKLGAAVVALGNNFATTESDIVEMAQRLAASGKIAGLSETDIFALATAMSSVGIKAEAGGTAMTQTLTNIAQKVDAYNNGTTDALDSIAYVAGTSAEDFAKAWKGKPIDALQAFVSGLGRLNEEEESTYALLDDMKMSGIRQANMLQSLALASDVLTDAVQLSNDAYEENSALQKEAETRYSTTERQVMGAQQAFDNLKVELGETLLPVLTDLLKIVKDIIDWFSNLDDGTKETIAKFLLFTATLGPVITAISGIITAVGTLIPLFAGAGGLGAALSGLCAAGGPIALTVAALAGLGAAVGKVIGDMKELKELQAQAERIQENTANYQNDLRAQYEANPLKGLAADKNSVEYGQAVAAYKILGLDYEAGRQQALQVYTTVELNGEIVGNSVTTQQASTGKRVYGGT